MRQYYIKIRSRHPSHNQFRRAIRIPFKSVVRFGSTTEINDNSVELNSITAVQNSSNKLLMKKCFTKNNVKTADWWSYGEGCIFSFKGDDNVDMTLINQLPYPIVAKNIYGSRNNGNTLIKSQEQLEEWIVGKELNKYIFEKFYNYNREYRLHVSQNGCFYACRKMLRVETPENMRWFRNDSNSVWILEENAQFDKPVNWDNIVEESIKAMKSVGLDFAAIDLRVQSSRNSDGEIRINPEFIILETNSAPSMGEITAQKYFEEIPKLLIQKNDFINNNNNNTI